MNNYEFYDKTFDNYKEYLTKYSKYAPEVVKDSTNTISKFPTVVFTMSNNTDTDTGTVDRIEMYDAIYFTITIYTKDKIKNNNVMTASQIISNELGFLTTQFFGNIMGMKKTQDTPVPNIDTRVYRRVINYQCYLGNVRGNIIRR